MKVYLERLFRQSHHQTRYIWKLITSLALIFKIIPLLSPLALFFLLILCIKMQPG